MKMIRHANLQGVASRAADIFQYPILADLCSCLEQRHRNTEDTEEVMPQSQSTSTATERMAKYFGEVDMREYVLSMMQVTLEKVEDVVPATDFQASCVSAGLLDTRGYSNYLQIDLKGHVKFDAMESALRRLMAAHTIMRTAFIPYKDRLFQVIQSRGNLEFEELQCEDVEASTQGWIDDDLRKPSLLKTATLRAVAIRAKAQSVAKNNSTRLLLQLSHARYDGTCLPGLVEDLTAAIEGNATQLHSDFADFSHHVSEQAANSQARSYWCERLAGSEMTHLVPTMCPTTHRIVNSTVSRSIKYEPVSRDGTSFASLLQAAWAIVLSSITGEDDVVFGHLVSGRNNMIPLIESVVGACINVIPVRVRLSSHDNTWGADTLAQVKEQYALALPFETVGYRTIIEDCTSWPKWTRFSTIVQHQNLAVGNEGGTAASSYKIYTPDHDSCDVWVISVPAERETTLHFNYSSSSIPLCTAEAMLDLLISTIEQYCDAPSNVRPGQVLPTAILDWMGQRELDPSENHSVSNFSPDQPVDKHVEDVWKQVVRPNFATDSNIPAYDLRGGFHILDQFQIYYQSKGYPVTLEDMFRHPTMATQTSLLHDRIHLPKSVNVSDGLNGVDGVRSVHRVDGVVGVKDTNDINCVNQLNQVSGTKVFNRKTEIESVDRIGVTIGTKEFHSTSTSSYVDKMNDMKEVDDKNQKRSTKADQVQEVSSPNFEDSTKANTIYQLLLEMLPILHHHISSADSDGTSKAATWSHPPTSGLNSLEPAQLRKILPFPLPHTGLGAEGSLKFITTMFKTSVNTWDQGFMDKLYASTNPVGVAAELTLAILNASLHVYKVSPALSLVEKDTAKQLAGMFGLTGPFSGGVSQAGGSASNLTSIVIARNHMFPSTKMYGLSSQNAGPAPKNGRLVLFANKDCHYSIQKAVEILGLGSLSVRKVPTDNAGRMQPLALEDLVVQSKQEGYTPFYVCATAGTTVLGAFDPLEDIADICNRHALWMHVDASWGGAFTFAPQLRHKLKGAERANSITFNPHKMLGAPVTCSFLMATDMRIVAQADRIDADYLFHDPKGVEVERRSRQEVKEITEDQDNEVYDLARLTIQCGRRGDAFKFALGWTWYGSDGYGEMVQSAWEQACYLTNLVKDRRDLLELASSDPPECLQVCFYYNPDSDAYK
jgi:glutamate decarboxylase